MSKEKFGRAKQSSTISAKVAYETLLENGYTPRLLNPDQPLISLNWSSVIADRNVVHSKSGLSIEMIDETGQGRISVDVKIKGMMSESSIAYITNHASVPMKPSP